MSDEPTTKDGPASSSTATETDLRSNVAWRRVIADVLQGGRIALLIPITLAVLAVLFPAIDNNAYWVRELSLIAVLALVVSGVNLSFGYAGELQFGQVFMYGLGAYIAMILAGRAWDEIMPLLLIAGLAAALLGAVIAIPAVRFGGWSLALTSFFLVITIPDLVAIFQKYTGGLNGLVDIPTPDLVGHALGNNGLYEVTIVVTIVWFTIYRNLVTSRYGVIFRILRQSPILANSLGFSTQRLKATAFILGAFPAGMAGCLFGFISLVITPDTFGLTLAIGIVAGSLLGGVESVYGVFVAAAILQLGPQTSLSFAEYAPVAYGAFLILAAVVFRGGLSGLGKLAARRVSALLASGSTRVVTDILDAAPDSANALDSPGAALETRPELSMAKLPGVRLSVESATKSFGGNVAVNDVSIAAEPGRVTALIGANGSGKTTVLNLICGYVKADQGTIRLGDATLNGMAPHQVARAGVGRTFQTPSVPRGVSVLNVVASGRYCVDRCGLVASVLRLPSYRRSLKADRVEAMALLELIGLAHLADEEASKLSLGVRRLVEVARALCTNPGLLLLDEPASGLNEEEVERLGDLITAAATAGATVILIEHNFNFVRRVSELAHVLEFGNVIAFGAPDEVAKNPRVIESFLGETPSEHAASTTPEPLRDDEETTDALPINRAELRSLVMIEVDSARSGTLLEVRHIVSGYGDLQVLRGLSLELEAGKLEVILGRNGVGKTTLLSTITGQIRLWNGSIMLDGRDVARKSVYWRAGAGIALVQEGKRIFRQRTIIENVALGTFTLSVSRRERRQLCDEVLDHFPVLRERAGELAGGLSGGQQQMLAIAQALAAQPRILLLDEPSAGLAPAIVNEVFQRIKELSDHGMTILLVEQLAEQALKIADHVTVIDSGQVVAEGSPSEFRDRRGLQRAYFGGSSL